MRNILHKFFIAAVLMHMGWIPVFSQDTQFKTYCNPINIDYTYMIYNAHKNISYRSGADPAVVRFQNEYYMFVTRSMGYWHSTDLNNWSFVLPEKWYFEGCNAPAAFNYKDSVVYVAGNPSGSMSILYTDNPKKGDWKAVPSILNNLQDPCLFIDDDGQAYMYWGSSNVHPIRGRKLDRTQAFKPSEDIEVLINKDEDMHGWERFGENNFHKTLKGYIEGPWMTRHENTYYLMYGAPGTEFNVYGDGVYTSDSPLGPFSYAPNNPVALKPGGFMNGAGHSSHVEGPQDTYWHFGTMALSLNVNWERRIGMWRSYFDKDGLMHTDTYFGDYPHFVPSFPGKPGDFAGWMLLSFHKPVKASSQVGEHSPEKVVDEDCKSYWLAQSAGDDQWIEIDLEDPANVYAIQVNYQDHQSDIYGKVPELYHRYVIEGSLDRTTWEVLADRRNNFLDVPNDYIELSSGKKSRYIRFRNIHVPTSHLAISGLRVFGKGEGKKPGKVSRFTAERMEDERNALLKWEKQKNSQGYNILWGIAPDKLYSSWMIYDENELELRSLTKGQSYYFTIEAFNENGVSERVKTIKIE